MEIEKELKEKKEGCALGGMAQPHSSDPLQENEADRSECALKMFPF